MAKPIIPKITPVDSRYEFIVEINYSGNLPYSNKITIYDATTLSVVYSNTVETHLLRHTVPANTLTNGTKYAIDCQVFDSSGEASAISDKVYFWAYETPIFEFVGLDTTLENSNLTLQLNYSQSNGEELYNYKFSLYDANRILLEESDILYDVTNTTYSFKGLENHKTYYVQATGTTKNGISLDTGSFGMFVDYKNPNSYARVYTECDVNGTVYGYTNMVLIEPDADPSEYTFEDGWINLTDKSLVYDKDFIIKNDFTMTIKVKNIIVGKELLNVSNGLYSIVVTSFLFDDGIRFKLIVSNGVCDYVLYSDVFTDTTANFCIHVRRDNNVYLLNVLTYEEDGA